MLTALRLLNVRHRAVIEHAGEVGDRVIGPALRELGEASRLVGDIRGSGVMWAIELVSDQQARTPLSPGHMTRIKAALVSSGLVPLVIDNRIHVAPPAIITSAEAARGIQIISDVLAQTSR